MAKASNTAKAGSVTVSTVRRREEAFHVAKQLESAGIECAVVVERVTVPAGGGRQSAGGIKVQVDRNDAKRAIELLREQRNVFNPTSRQKAPLSARLQLPAGGWLRTSLEVAAILAAATALAVGFFF
jgi:hypothetical protein